MRFKDPILQAPSIGRILRHRFIKFGTVGFSGTFINLSALYLNQEYLFRGIAPIERRLHLSLAGAIFLATLSNYVWNRTWTWSDRKGKARRGFFLQMGEYFLASGLAIGIQYICTIGFCQFMHYLLANIFSIGVAALFTYLVNDLWTFAVRKKLRFRNKAFRREAFKT